MDVLLGVEVTRYLYDLVGRAGMERAAVVGSDDGHGGDSELAARSEHALRDLTAVRDEQLLDRHERSLGGAVGHSER